MKTFKDYIVEIADSEEDGGEDERKYMARREAYRNADHFLADVIMAHHEHMKKIGKYDEDYYGSIGDRLETRLHNHFLATHYPHLFPKKSDPERHTKRENELRESFPHIEDFIFSRIKEIKPKEKKEQEEKENYGDYEGYGGGY